MSAGIVVAVLFAAVLHASWNTLVKSGEDQALDTALIHLFGCALGAVMVVRFGWPDAAAWPWLAASVVVHLGYYVTLVGAYRHGDLGFAYPIMRGCAPLLVALGGVVLAGEHLSGVVWIGIAGISGGVLAIGASSRAQPGRSRRRAAGYALGNAAIIAAYTVIDGLGTRAAGDPMTYVSTLFMVDGLPYFAITLLQRRRALPATTRYLRQRAPAALLGAFASLGSYGIALWAMTKAPIAAVAAVRETSVLFATLLGAAMLGERLSWRRLGAAALICAGIAGVQFGAAKG